MLLVAPWAPWAPELTLKLSRLSNPDGRAGRLKHMDRNYTQRGGFHKWEVPPVIIHFRLGFSMEINQPAIRDPHFWKPPCASISGKIMFVLPAEKYFFNGKRSTISNLYEV